MILKLSTIPWNVKKPSSSNELTFQTSFEVRFEIMIQAPQIDGEIDPANRLGKHPSSIQSLVMYLVAENQELKDRLNRIEEN
jgi:hypothetical protein